MKFIYQYSQNKKNYTQRIFHPKIVPLLLTLYQDKLTTDKKPTVGYSIPDEIPATCFQLCKIDVFTSNIMVWLHKMSQIVKIKVNRHTNIYLLMNLFKINQFIFIFSCISALLSFIQQNFF